MTKYFTSVHYRVQKNPPVSSILIRINLFLYLTNFFKISFITIYPPGLRFLVAFFMHILQLKF
jgi:hypothetical protein